MSKGKSISLWIISLIVMMSIAIYQRMTGPTYPVKGCIKIENSDIHFKLPRSHGGDGGQEIEIEAADKTINGKMTYKRFKSHDEWTTIDLVRKGNILKTEIPHQPPAGKVIYDIVLNKDGADYKLSDELVIIRFKGYVPLYFLIPHVLFMFTAMWFSMRTGMEAIFKGENTLKLAKYTVFLLILGGMILGPVIQKYAFGEFWTGWPWGHDLTDNKTLAAFILWIVALWRIKKNPAHKWWAIIAAIGLLAVYLIPHSVLGSEIDYTKIEQ